MADETLTIYVWADNSWESEEEIDDMDWYLSRSGKNDDYKEYQIPIELEADDITELIELKALPGMIPPPGGDIEYQGIIKLPKDSILVLRFPAEGDVPYLTHLEGKMIVNCSIMSIELLKGK